MDIFIAKTVHVIAAFALFMSFGAIFFAADPKRSRSAMMVHGIAMVLLIAVGLHLLFAQKLTQSGGWWHAKILIALLIGVAPLFVRRQLLSPKAASALCLLLGSGATFLAIAKPF